MPWQAILFAISLVFTAVAWWRAGRATKLAERAELRANAAESRAEEAHAILRDRFASDKERAEAEIEAGQIVDRWVGQLRIATDNAERGRNTHGNIRVPASTLAERLAVERIRSRMDDLSLVEVVVSEGHVSIGMWTRSVLARRARR